MLIVNFFFFFWHLDLYLEKVNITVERFESSGVTVTLHWWLTVEHYYYQSYDINVVPQSFEQSILNFKERMHIHVQLKVLYNTSYNVTLIAIPFCGQNNVTSSVQELYFNPSKYNLATFGNCATIELHNCFHVCYSSGPNVCDNNSSIIYS